MNARNDVKRPSDQSLDARLVLAAAQLRFAAGLIFSWLAGSSAAPRTPRPRNGCSSPIGSRHVSSGWA